MAAASGMLAWIGWAFLPGFASSTILKIYYRLITRAGDPQPRPGSARYARDYRRVHFSVIVLYLLYTIAEVYEGIRRTPNFYEVLGVPYDVDAAALRSRFRRLSVQFHPDKVGAGGGGGGSAGGEYFVELKTAYDTLSSPAKRFAYERFGPEVLGDAWRHCGSAFEFLQRGAMQLVPLYGVSVMFLLAMTVLGQFEFGRYWRFFTLTLVLTFEAAVLTRPYSLLPHIPFLPRQLAPFEQLILARKIALSCTIAIQQLAPILRSSTTSSSSARGGQVNARELTAQLDRLARYAGATDAEATRLVQMELMPFVGAKEDGGEGGEAGVGGKGVGGGGGGGGWAREIQRKMQATMVELAVRQDPEVRDAIGRVVQRRRQNAPAGAQGTK